MPCCQSGECHCITTIPGDNPLFVDPGAMVAGHDRALPLAQRENGAA